MRHVRQHQGILHSLTHQLEVNKNSTSVLCIMPHCVTIGKAPQNTFSVCDLHQCQCIVLSIAKYDASY